MPDECQQIARALHQVARALDALAETLTSGAGVAPASVTSGRRTSGIRDLVFDAVVQLGGAATYHDLTTATGKSYASVYQALSKLVAEGRLEREGARGHIVWKVPAA